MIDGNVYHLQATVKSHPSMGLAYIDDGRPLEAHTFDDPVPVVMAHDQIDGQRGSAGTVAYSDLLAAVKATANDSGVASAKDVTAFLGARYDVDGPRSSETVDGVTKYGKLSHIAAVPGCPPGLMHPVVDYAFRMVGDSLQIDYKVQKGVEIVKSIDVAILDNDGTRTAAGENDSLLTMHIRDHASRNEYFGNMVGFDMLGQAVNDLGGRASESAVRAQLTKQLGNPNLEVSAFVATPDPLANVDRPVEKVFTTQPNGSIFVEYQLGEGRTYTGGWSAST